MTSNTARRRLMIAGAGPETRRATGTAAAPVLKTIALLITLAASFGLAGAALGQPPADGSSFSTTTTTAPDGTSSTLTTTTGSAAAPVTSSNGGALSGVLQTVSPDQAHLTFQVDHGALDTLAVIHAADREKLIGALPGDHVTLTVDNLETPTTATSVQSVSRPISVMERIGVFLGSALVLVALAAAATGFRPQRFVIGSDGLYSKSQFQLAMWFGTAATVYLAATVLRVWHFGLDYIGGISVTTNVLALTGLSAFTFGSAKFVAVQKSGAATDSTSMATAPAAADPAPPPADPAAQAPAPAPAPTQVQQKAAPPATGLLNVLQQLVNDNQGTPDFGDFQMLLITLAAVAIFGLSAYAQFGDLALLKSITLPDVDTALLGAFGLGHGAYLYKKAVTPNG